MFNFLKSTFGSKSTSPDAEALVEEFAGQNGRLYPFDLKNFTAGVKFLHAQPEIQRATVMEMLAWFENHPPPAPNDHDRNTWQVL